MIVLVLGGASSGKSALAERRCAQLPPPVTYVATWRRRGDDPDMDARVAAHRARRPADWAVREVGDDLPGELRALAGTVLVDAVGTWVAGVDDFAVDAGDLVAALRERRGDTVVVSDEVGLGVHPSTAIGGRFREVLGAVNTAVAGAADEAWLAVAGRAVPLAHAPW